jgi:hypothetical protein
MNELITIRPGLVFPRLILKRTLPDIETALFFAKLFKFDAQELGILLYALFRENSVLHALTQDSGAHSHELQDYLVELGYQPEMLDGLIAFDRDVRPQGEILPELWQSLQVEIATSIQQVADKLKNVVGTLPGKHGQMMFSTLATLNAKRATIGDYKARIQHTPAKPNLIVFDVSGSMSENTVRALVGDVVALSWEADAHLAIVSNTTTHWHPGEFSEQAVLHAAEYGGTHYETLKPLFDSTEWGVVVSIADYDSSPAAKSALRDCTGSIEQVLDISLVDRPTYLSEVLGQLANEVRPLLMAQTSLTYTY